MLFKLIKFILLFFSLSFLFLILLYHSGYSQTLNQFDQLLCVSIGSFKDGFYDVAEIELSTLLKQYPKYNNINDIYYLFGKTLLLRGKFKESKLAFSKILLSPRHFDSLDDVYMQMAYLEMMLGYKSDATKHLLFLVNNYPKYYRIDYCYFLLGVLSFEASDFSNSEFYLNNVLSLSNNNNLIQSSLFWLGLLTFKHNQYSISSNYFKHIWENRQSTSPDFLKYAFFWFAESQLKLGNFNDANSYFRIFCDRFKNDPMFRDAFWRIGFCEYQLGYLKKSSSTFQSFIEQFKDSSLSLSARYYLGKLYYFNNNYPSSIKELSFLSSLSQNHLFKGISSLLLYWNQINIGNQDDSIRTYQQLLKSSFLEDDKLFVQLLRSDLLFSIGDTSEALPYYFNILNSRFREKALSHIGKGYFFDNKFRESVTNYDILLLEFPNSTYFDEAQFIKGECLLKLGDLDQSIETFSVLSQSINNNTWKLFALTQLGELYSFKKESDKSILSFKKVYRSYSFHPLYYYASLRLGYLYFKYNSSDSLSYFSNIIKRNVRDLLGEAYFCLGEVYIKQKRFEKALDYFENGRPYIQDNSLLYFLTCLEIGNLKRREGLFSDAKISYRVILDQSKDVELQNASRELLNRLSSPD